MNRAIKAEKGELSKDATLGRTTIPVPWGGGGKGSDSQREGHKGLSLAHLQVAPIGHMGAPSRIETGLRVLSAVPGFRSDAVVHRTRFVSP